MLKNVHKYPVNMAKVGRFRPPPPNLFVGICEVFSLIAPPPAKAPARIMNRLQQVTKSDRKLTERRSTRLASQLTGCTMHRHQDPWGYTIRLGNADSLRFNRRSLKQLFTAQTGCSEPCVHAAVQSCDHRGAVADPERCCIPWWRSSVYTKQGSRGS